MDTWLIILISVVSALVFLFILFVCLGEIVVSISLKRKSLIGKYINKRMHADLPNYKIEHSWWKKHALEEVCVTSFDGVKLYPKILYQKRKTNKVALVVHGYYSSYLDMNMYANMFYNLGYNVVATENRCHGKSEGKFIGMGWLDRLDVLNVIDMILDKFGSDVEIDIFGLSMGGATVCMLAGETLPKNIKHLISDCGYASIFDQFVFVYEQNTRMPGKWVASLARFYIKFRCGYDIREADATKKLSNCKVPILYIHGDKDELVDYENLNKLYDATPENLRYKKTFKDAKHAECFPHNQEEYTSLVTDFLADKLNKD